VRISFIVAFVNQLFLGERGGIINSCNEQEKDNDDALQF